MTLFVVDDVTGEAVDRNGDAWVLLSSGRWAKMLPGGPGALRCLAKWHDQRRSRRAS